MKSKTQQFFVRQIAFMVVFIIMFASIVISLADEYSANFVTLTRGELEQLISDIDRSKNLYHDPTSAQRDAILKVTKSAVENHLSGMSNFSWPWFDYTYTKDWDFYTLTTSVDYRDSSKTSHTSKVYAEGFANNGGSIALVYLKVDDTIVLDNRSSVPVEKWVQYPQGIVNQRTGINLSALSADELSSLKDSANAELQTNHTTNGSINDQVLSLTKTCIEQYFANDGIKVDWPWFDYEYTCDWGLYTLETRVDYRPVPGGSKIKDKVYAEAYPFNGVYELTYLTVGKITLIDNRASVSNTVPDTGSVGAAVTETGDSSKAPSSETSSDSMYSHGINIDLSAASDEELIEALAAVKAEQRSRIKTKIELDTTALTLKKGATQKITANVVDLCDGVTSGKLVWSSSDKAVATVSGNTITAAGAGTATITCSTTLSDGTELYEECVVTVYIPVSSVSVEKKKIDLGLDQASEVKFVVKPDNATTKGLTYSSSDTSVVTVDNQGRVFGKNIGTATITATSNDGTEKSASISVVVTKKDDVGVTKTTRKGLSITLLKTRTSKGSGFFKPSSGNVFVFPEFELANNTDSEVKLSTLLDISVYCDGYSVSYSFEAACAEKGKGLNVSVFPGKKTKGEYGIEVPNDWKEIEVRISHSWTDDTLSFVINHQ